MTQIKPLTRFIESDLADFVATKENPEEWYVLIGSMVTEYSVWADEDLPEDYEAVQNEMPPEDRDANPNAEGYFQIGTAGWTSDAFDFGDDDSGFVSEVQWGDKVDRRLLNILLVHESVLSDEALAVANDEEVEA